MTLRIRGAIHFKGGGNAAAMLKYCLKRQSPEAKKRGLPAHPDGRVERVFGDFGDYGAVTGDANIDARTLTAPGSHLRGRATRMPILSIHPDDVAAAKAAGINVFDLLEDETKRLMEKIAPGAPYIAIIHRDTNHPHVHVIVANYDPVRDRRLDFSPKLVRDLKSMKWSVGLRDSTLQESERQAAREKPRRRSRHGEEVASISSSRHQLRKAKMTELDRLSGQAGGLEKLMAEKRLTLKFHAQGGRVLAHPAIVFAGEPMRVDKIADAGFPALASRLRQVGLSPAPAKVLPTKLPGATPWAIAQKAVENANEKSKKDRTSRDEKEKQDRMKKGINVVGKQLGSMLAKKILSSVLPKNPLLKIIKPEREME